MRILSFTTLYPNSAQPIHGVFVENRLRQLAATGEVELRVVAPVPWFPPIGRWAGRYGMYVNAPRREVRHGLSVEHPRYPLVPKIGMTIAPTLLALSQRATVARIIREGYDFDLLDAHYFYPDGVAAALLGHWFNKPVVITGRGTDLSQIPAFSLPRRQIQWAAAHAAGMITVCQALKDSLVGLGVAEDRVTVLRNGVDLQSFRRLSDAERTAAREKYGLSGFALGSVGHLIERKGHHLVIEALSKLPGTQLCIAGAGPEHHRLMALAQTQGVADRVRLLGVLPHSDLPRLYGALDALVLASSREGWANVLLESMACGTPVVASRIWGTPEVVSEPAAGILMPERSGAGVAAGVKALMAAMPSRDATRAYAERFSWDATTEGQLSLFRTIIAQRSQAVP
ncbi:MAG: glycosyltransferase family 4 protein [Rhodospirillaceae bacterium]|nr:MAG: glycosyltransferase family 4 protein [Rhodospirillaceae bacterium]